VCARIQRPVLSHTCIVVQVVGLLSLDPDEPVDHVLSVKR
jgi:hypothetical protein